MKGAFLDFYRGLVFLQGFAMLNYTGFPMSLVQTRPNMYPNNVHLQHFAGFVKLYKKYVKNTDDFNTRDNLLGEISEMVGNH